MNNINQTFVPVVEKRGRTFTGRAVGVGSALVGAALDVYAHGVRTSNISGAVCGGVVGYVIGDMVDGIQSVTNTTQTSLLALTAVVGFTTSVGTAVSCRGLDKETESKSNDHEHIELNFD